MVNGSGPGQQILQGSESIFCWMPVLRLRRSPSRQTTPTIGDGIDSNEGLWLNTQKVDFADG